MKNMSNSKITYELAKKLKDAGFVATLKFGNYYYDKNGEFKNWAFPEDREPSYEQGDWCIPTLPELIEACGDKISLHHDGTMWSAGKIGEIIDNGLLFWNVRFSRAVLSETPEEAVANLWLELNKKQ